MNSFKTILISALTFFLLSWIPNHPLLFILVTYITLNCLTLCYLDIGEGSFESFSKSVKDLFDHRSGGAFLGFFVLFFALPYSFFYYLTEWDECKSDYIANWKYFFKTAPPKITFQSPIKIETPTE